MDGEQTLLVGEASATDGRYWTEGKPGCYALNKDHSHLVKFKPSDESYRSVLKILREVVSTALGQGQAS
jgi:hypothetical protein